MSIIEIRPTIKKEFRMRFTSSIGMILLSIYLILVGLMTLAGVAIPAIVMGILALAAGILILLGK
jgi:hypothetical protein